MAPQYYKHSGGFSPVGVGVGLVLGIGATFGLGFAYSYLSSWIPLIYLRALFLFGMAMGTGAVLGFVGLGAKVRNPALLTVLGLILGVAGVYCQWIAHFHANTDPGMWLVNPSEMWAMLGLMAKTGVWEIFDWTPTGGGLWAFWIVEAAIIIIGTLMVGLGMVDDPFCEKTGAWADGKVQIQPLAVPDDVGAFAAQVARDPVQALHGQTEPDDDDDPAFLRAEIAYVEGQEERCDHFLSLSLVTLSYDDEGDISEDATQVMPYLVIDRATAEALLEV